MHSLRDTAHRLTNQMQTAIGFLEMDEPKKALVEIKACVATLHNLGTAVAVGFAQIDADAAEIHRLTAELAARNPRCPNAATANSKQ